MVTAESVTLDLSGEVCSGLAEGAVFTRLDWVRREFLAKLGFEPYPGTFNLRVGGAPWSRARELLQSKTGIEIVPSSAYCAAKCFRVVLDGRVTGAAVLPAVERYPNDKLEILAPVCIREALRVTDGDRVAVRVVV